MPDLSLAIRSEVVPNPLLSFRNTVKAGVNRLWGKIVRSPWVPGLAESVSVVPFIPL